MTAVSSDEPGHKPLSQCKMVPVVLTLYAGEDDHQYRLSQGCNGVPALRQRQIERMAHEALDQACLLTAEDFAFLMQISPTLVRRYQELYEQYNTPPYQERIDEIIATVRARGFRPSQLENACGLPSGEKKGAQR